MGADTGPAGSDRVFVRFTKEPRENEVKSAAEGRPIFEEVEYVEIQVPGDKTSTVHRPLTVDDKKRFAKPYRAWKEGETATLSGTPLAQWAPISRGQVEELAYFNIRTVEQLAAVSDGNMQRMGPLSKLRNMAQDFIAQAKGNAPAVALRKELDAKDEIIANLQRQLKEQGDRIDALAKKAKG